jgi:hypothetical protein
VVFDSQDGDVYIKLEMMNEEGSWERAQGHQYSDCGNSYFPMTVLPGMFYRLLGYQPTSGREAKVRYSSYSGRVLKSNVAMGRVSDADVAKARVDSMSINFLPSTLRYSIDPEWRRPDVNPELLVQCLTLIRDFGPVPAAKVEAELRLREWASASTSNEQEKKAARDIEEILSSEWADDFSEVRLLKRCLDRLEGKTKEALIPKALMWKVIGEMARMNFGMGRQVADQTSVKPLEEWRRATLLAVDHFGKSSAEELGGIRQLLSVNGLTDRFVTSDVVESLLKMSGQYEIKLAADTLARRGLTERLAVLAMDMPAANQPTVLGALACGGVRYDMINPAAWRGVRSPGAGTKEALFWEHVMRTQAVEACNSLRYLTPNDLGPDAFGPIVIDGLRSFWREKIRRSDLVMKDFEIGNPSYAERLSVDFLGRSKRKEDVSLFRDLLTYGGYELQKGVASGADGKSVPFVKRFFGVRVAALTALGAMGEQVPLNVVIESDVSDPEHVIEKMNGEVR